MAIILHKFSLDLYGNSPENRVTEEVYRVGSNRAKAFVPRHGPFYADSVDVADARTGRRLRKGIDYKLLHYYKEPSNKAGLAVYSAVYLLDPEITDKVLFSGQHVGGEYSYHYKALSEVSSVLINDSRSLYWKDLVGVPKSFKPAPHYHRLEDFVGWGPLTSANLEIASAELDSDRKRLGRTRRQVDSKLRTVDTFMRTVIEQYQNSLYTLRESKGWVSDSPTLYGIVKKVVETGYSYLIDFSPYSVNGVETSGHKDSDFLIATDPNFNNVIWSSLKDTLSKTSISPPILTHAGDLYLRARYTGIEYPSSAWTTFKLQ